MEEAVEFGLGGFRRRTSGSGGGFVVENPLSGFQGGFATGGGQGLRSQFVWEAHV